MSAFIKAQHQYSVISALTVSSMGQEIPPTTQLVICPPDQVLAPLVKEMVVTIMLGTSVQIDLVSPVLATLVPVTLVPITSLSTVTRPKRPSISCGSTNDFVAIISIRAISIHCLQIKSSHLGPSSRGLGANGQTRMLNVTGELNFVGSVDYGPEHLGRLHGAELSCTYLVCAHCVIFSDSTLRHQRRWTIESTII